VPPDTPTYFVAVIVVPVIAAAVVPPIAGGLDKSKVPPKVRLPLEVTVPLSDIPETVPVPPTLVTVPPLDGLVLVIVKLGYVPLVDIPVPAVKTTVWSGAVLVIVKVPLLVIGLPDTLIPVPAVAATLVTVPTETDPPNAVELPLIVMAEFTRAELGIDVRLAPEPLKVVAVMVVPVIALAVVAPIVILSIVPTLVGAISIEPVPVGFIWT
jgi:hypothetical protein